MPDPFEFFAERFAEHQAKRLAASWFCADRNEQRARLRLVIALAVELEKIRSVSIFATGLGEGLIEYVIEGDWDRVSDAAQGFKFKDERDETRSEYEPLWRDFVRLAELGVLEGRIRGGNSDGPTH